MIKFLLVQRKEILIEVFLLMEKLYSDGYGYALRVTSNTVRFMGCALELTSNMICYTTCDFFYRLILKLGPTGADSNTRSQ